MIKDKNRILYILFAIDVLISLFFAIIVPEKNLILACLVGLLFYHIPTILMLLSFLYLVPSKYNNFSIVALTGNICMTTIFWCSTVTTYWFHIVLTYGLIWNMVYGIVSLIISLLLKVIDKNGC